MVNHVMWRFAIDFMTRDMMHHITLHEMVLTIMSVSQGCNLTRQPPWCLCDDDILRSVLPSGVPVIE